MHSFPERPRKTGLGFFARVWFAFLLMGHAGMAAEPAPVDLVIDSSKTAGAIDLTQFALGQGGLSDKPMFDSHVDQIAQLRPQTIRLFVQEYFNRFNGFA
jgi:hypothetical protein